MKPFTTEVNGSFSRPDWLLERGLEDQSSVDDAIKLTIKEQEMTGVDIITDGEQERTSFVGYIGSRLPGFATVPRETLNPQAEATLKEKKTLLTKVRAVCVDPIRSGDLGVEDYLKAKAWVESKILKVSLPAPYLVMWETYHAEKSKEAYAEPEDMALDYAKILRENILNLYDKGLRFITIDEPMLGDLTEADEKPDRYHEGLTLFYGQRYRGFKEELRLGVELLNRAVQALPSDLYVTVHMDRWPIPDSPHLGEGYERLMPEISEIKCDQLDLEFKSPGCGDPRLTAKPLAEAGKALGVGCVSVTDTRIESPEEIAEFVKPVIDILGPEKVMLVPNCGFAPGMGKKFPRDIAFAKLRRMAKAADILRQEHGGYADA